MNEYNKDKESSCFMYWDANNLYGRAMLDNLLVNNFEYKENASNFANHTEY